MNKLLISAWVITLLISLFNAMIAVDLYLILDTNYHLIEAIGCSGMALFCMFGIYLEVAENA